VTMAENDDEDESRVAEDSAKWSTISLASSSSTFEHERGSPGPLVPATDQAGVTASSVNATPNRHGAVVFLGMDAPELHLDEIVHALNLSGSTNAVSRAFISPSHDGGYGMISVPPHAPPTIFTTGVRWSDPLTCVSQIKALTDHNVDVTLGSLMYDIDVPSDLEGLATRLCQLNPEFTTRDNPNDERNDAKFTDDSKKDVLHSPPLGLDGPDSNDVTSRCRHTFLTLIRLGFVRKRG